MTVSITQRQMNALTGIIERRVTAMRFKKLTVEELLKMDIDIDIIDDYDERCYIAFCGGYALTEEGKKKFSHMLDREVEIHTDTRGYEWGVISAENAKEADEAKEFFYSLAGFCPDSLFNKWFMYIN